MRRLFVLVLLAAMWAPAGARQAALPSDVSAGIDAVLRKAIDGGLPGASLAIAVDNKLVYSKGFGKADLEHDIPVTPRTAFRTASVAKPITATGVMLLVRAGKMDLDAPIRQYCAEWPAKHPTITARQVLGHVAGIRHYARQGESTGTTAYFSIGESLAAFKDDALLHAPGTKYLYSTHGYTLLGCAIEGASGMPYADYMAAHVFGPAGMTATRLDFHYGVIPNRARGYMLLSERDYNALPASARAIAKPGVIYNAPLHDTSMKVPGGGLLSTAEDLVRFGIAINTGTLLPKDAVESMWTELSTPDGKTTGYGLGWGVTPAQDGIRRLTHAGNQAGASTVLHVIPEEGVVIALMTNLEDFEAGTLSRQAAGVLREYVRSKR
jgi:serine beta-lactamase-like protein LACTB